MLRELLGTEHAEGVRIVPRGEPELVLPVTGVFVYLQGGKPITYFRQGQLPTSNAGCLVVDRKFQTAIPRVYAAGDVLCQHVKQVVVSAAEGAVAAMAAEKQLRGLRQITVDWAKEILRPGNFRPEPGRTKTSAILHSLGILPILVLIRITQGDVRMGDEIGWTHRRGTV
jgi:hypothetical protein